MKRQTVKLVQSESFLPSIKTKSTSSPKSIFLNLLSNDTNRIHKSPNNLFNEASSPKPTHSLNLNLNKKVSNLIKIIQDQDSKIKSIESELHLNSPTIPIQTFNPYNLSEKSQNASELDSFIEHDTAHELNSLGGSEKYDKDQTSMSISVKKTRDIEIFKMKRQIEEENKIILKLQSENLVASQKLALLEATARRNRMNEGKIEEVKLESSEMVENIEQDIEVTLKNIEDGRKQIEQLAEALMKCEEKRNYSNEYNIFLENKQQVLMDKLKMLREEKDQILKQIAEIQEKIKDQELLIQELLSSLTKAQSELESQKQSTENLQFKYETAQEALKESQNQNNLEFFQFQSDINNLEKSGSNFPETNKKQSSINDQLFLFNLVKKDTLKLQQKFNKVEKDLTYAREALERLKKNELYLKNQLLVKELMINQIEKMLQVSENNGQDDKKKDDEPHNDSRFNRVKELRDVIKNMNENYSNLSSVKCVKCGKFDSNLEILVPCGHLLCSGCCLDGEGTCGSCGGRVEAKVKSKVLSKTVGRLKSNLEKLSRANKLLKQS